jgi:Protein of unknown function (DUF1565)
MNNRSKQKRRVQRAVMDCLEPRRLLSTTIYVDSIAPGTNDGSSWANAFTTLQSALAVATTGDTIEVGQGTYYPTSGTDQTATFQLIDGVSVLGGYAGYGTTNPDARDVTNNQTILSGAIGINGGVPENGYNGSSYDVVTGSGTNSTADLDGFTISGGGLNYGGAAAGVGGMYNSGGSPTLTDCTFTQNYGVECTTTIYLRRP